ncbi:MAG: carbohydrate ABC transporter permease [Clostridia bacterium]|nr:carbohydrate ABC transporter permease [Clostridia bacterium]
MALKFKRKHHKKFRLNRSAGGNAAINVLLCFMGAFMVLPMVYAISNSLKPLSELWIYPPQFFVENPTLKNFRDLFNMMSDSWVPFSRYLANTIFISVVGTTGHVIISSLCAYALAKHNFPGRDFLFKIVVFSLMFSTVVTGVPSYLIMAKLGLIDSHWSIILPAFCSSLGLYLMKQFMEANIPDTLIEAAHIDGAGENLVFFRIIMPLVKPAWLTLVIFSFQGLWGTQATTTIRSEELKTLSYALSQVVAGGIARQGASAAASVIMMIVPILVFVLTQSNVVETVATSGMKD